MLRLIEEAPCYPVTTEETRRHLVIDTADSSVNSVLNMMIAAASNDAETRTGRVWVRSKWQWTPDEIAVGTEIPFPVVPVTDVEVYDMDEVVVSEEDRTDISGSVVTIRLPSPEPQGEPLIGSLLPLSGFPTNFKIILTAGYPVTTSVTPIEQTDNPVLVVASTKYTATKISLTFNRPVSGSIAAKAFTVLVGGMSVTVASAEFVDGRVVLTFASGALVETETCTLTFVEGEIQDQFGNFVQPITSQALPTIAFGTEDDFVTPTPVPTETAYYSKAPLAVKNWILVRVGTLYSQRSELAGRAGTTMYGDEFLPHLLNPYKVRFV